MSRIAYSSFTNPIVAPPRLRQYCAADVYPWMAPDRLNELAAILGMYHGFCREGRQEVRQLCTQGFLECLLREIAAKLEDQKTA